MTLSSFSLSGKQRTGSLVRFQDRLEESRLLKEQVLDLIERNENRAALRLMHHSMSLAMQAGMKAVRTA